MVDGLRKILFTRLKAIGLDLNLPNITHISLFRFQRELEITEMVGAVRQIELPKQEWAITQMMLVREAQYPSLEYHALETFKLDVK